MTPADTPPADRHPVAVSMLDPYAEAVLLDPYPHYAALRRAARRRPGGLDGALRRLGHRPP